MIRLEYATPENRAPRPFLPFPAGPFIIAKRDVYKSKWMLLQLVQYFKVCTRDWPSYSQILVCECALIKIACRNLAIQTNIHLPSPSSQSSPSGSKLQSTVFANATHNTVIMTSSCEKSCTMLGWITKSLQITRYNGKKLPTSTGWQEFFHQQYICNQFYMDGNGQTTIFHVKSWFINQLMANHL